MPTEITLPTGEKALRYEPDANHPEGRIVLQRADALRERLDATYDDHVAASADLAADRQWLLEQQQARHCADPCVPEEKRAV